MNNPYQSPQNTDTKLLSLPIKKMFVSLLILVALIGVCLLDWTLYIEKMIVPIAFQYKKIMVFNLTNWSDEELQRMKKEYESR